MTGILRGGAGAAAASGYPLNEPLPPGMALGGQSILAFYKRYPVFGWPWIWRRFVLYSPLAIVPALIIGLDYGASFHDPDVATTCRWRGPDRGTRRHNPDR